MRPHFALAFLRTFVSLASLTALASFASPVAGEIPQDIRNLSNRRYFDETLRAIQDAKQSIFLVMYHLPLDPSNKASPISLDYNEAARLLGISEMSREAYRRQIIKTLKKLEHEYRLIRFEPRYGKDALVTLVDPQRPGQVYETPREDYFEIPFEFFSWGWLETLSLRAQYALLILYDQASYARTSPTIEVGLETLEKRYFVSRKTLGEGFRELARQNLLEIYYGRAIDFEKKEFETAGYVLLPFYDPKARDQKLKRLEALYGKYAFEKARDYAGAFFKEKDPEVLSTLLGLTLAYSPEWMELAMKKVILEKSVGNPARSLPYLIGILKAWKESGHPTFSD